LALNSALRAYRSAGRQLSAHTLSGTVVVTRDIDSIIGRLHETHPAVSIEQLQVSNPGDDAGIWFFRLPGQPNEVQLESSTGMCPFLIENSESDVRMTAESVEEAVSSLKNILGL
jgi:hypothetical protein